MYQNQIHFNLTETRFQQLKLPFDLEITIPEDDPVRLVSAQLEELDYTNLYRAYSPKGRKSTVAPDILFQICVYAYLCGIYSSRKIEEACRKRIDFMWLLDGQPAPDHCTIARFRTGKAADALQDLFFQYVRKLEVMEETEHDEVFIDGTKLESKANRYTFVWRKSIERYLHNTKEKVRTILKKHGISGNMTKKKLERRLETESAQISFVHGSGKRKSARQKEWETLYDCLEKWKKYEDQLFMMGNSRNSFSKTDPEATFMRMKDDHMRNGQLKPGYNVQLAVNSEYITGVAVFPNRSDSGTLIPFLKHLEQQHGQKYENVVADAGYESGPNYLYLESNGQRAVIKPTNYDIGKTKKFKEQIGRMENMRYDETEDCYYCHENRRLPLHHVSSEQKNGSIVTKGYYRCEDCTGCSSRFKCCRAKDPEKPKQLIVDFTVKEYRTRSAGFFTMQEGIQLRVNRSIQVEGAFGVLKHDRHFQRFLTGSRRNVMSELYLLCLAFDLKKLWSKWQGNRRKTHLFDTEKT